MFLIQMYLTRNLINHYLSKTLKSMRTVYCRQLSSNVDNNYILDEEVIKNERVFQELNAKQFEDLAENEEQMQKIVSILNDYEYTKYSTLEVPTNLSHKQMRKLLDLDSDERNRYMTFLYETEVRNLLDEKCKNIRKSLKKQELANKWKDSMADRSGIFDKNGDIVYGLWHNSLFTRISPQYLRRYSNNKLRTAALFGQNIVFDMSCEPNMKWTKCVSKFKQIVRCYTINKNRFREPFNLNFCNFDRNSVLQKAVDENQFISNFPHFLSEFTEKSYLDLFDRKSLVYLTPLAEKQMDFEPNKVYIISLNDGFIHQNYLSIQSRKEGIEFRKLPIDKHVFWSGRTKDLKAETVLCILNDVREGIEWKEAIERNVPQYFIKRNEVFQREEAYRMEKLTKQRKAIIDLKQIF